MGSIVMALVFFDLVANCNTGKSKYFIEAAAPIKGNTVYIYVYSLIVPSFCLQLLSTTEWSKIKGLFLE